ncbi:MAG: DUF6788 family protein [Planctomycetota bacterium]
MAKLTKEQLAKRLQDCRGDYERLKARIREVGFTCDGSLVVRWMVCGKPNCRCREDPAKRHGPYYQLSWKEQGTTVSRRLSPHQARLYQEWIHNRRLLESILAQMRVVSRKAGDCILRTTPAPQS